MRALVTGAGGQLGRALLAGCPEGVEVHGAGRDTLDVADPRAVERAFERLRPDVVINAAAFTAVDRAESEPERARQVNEEGVAHLAAAAAARGARLVQISTDYVFDGARGRPYLPGDETRPLGVYGATKLAGERRALSICGDAAVVLRTAWLYGAGHRNFVTAMLARLGAAERVEAAVDQVGAPTWVRSLAVAVWAAAREPRASGIHHWTDAGVASRYDLTVAIQEEAQAAGLLERRVPVEPVAADRFPAAAARPAYSVLELAPTRQALGLTATHWRRALRSMLEEVARG